MSWPQRCLLLAIHYDSELTMQTIRLRIMSASVCSICMCQLSVPSVPCHLCCAKCLCHLCRATCFCTSCLCRRSRPATIFSKLLKSWATSTTTNHATFNIHVYVYWWIYNIKKYESWWLFYIMIIANKQIVLTLKSWHAIHNYQNPKIIHIDAIKWSIWRCNES